MKARTLLLALAASMMLFVACDKEEDKPDNSGGGGNTPAVTSNTLVYDGVTYTGTANVSFEGTNLQYELSNNAENGFAISGIIENSAYNRTIDLTRHYTDAMFTIHINVGEILDLKYQNYQQNYWCFLNGESLENSSCFSSGTATFTVENNALTVTVDGTLINGKKLNYKVVVNGQGGSEPELTDNEMVIGSQHYMMQPTLSISSEGTYLFGASDYNGMFEIIADVPSTLLQQTVDLAQASNNNHYYINFQSTGLSFAIQRGDEPINEINGEEVSAVFSEGTMQLTRADGVVVLHVRGTLTNGTYVGFKMNVSESDIQAIDNQVVIDGQAYNAEVLARYWTDAALKYEVTLTTEAGQAIVTVEVEPDALNHTIDLTTTTPTYRYRVTVIFMDTQINATQDAFFTNDMHSSYWDITAQEAIPVTGCLFTSGSFIVGEDDMAIGLSLIGTLENGRSVSAQTRIDKSEIIETSVR
ncbi:MAG: hypothetical protein J6W88_05145 [Bacteroidales bacterium]|nr:hypothetical protein [Bacteroidales bacterium]